VTDDAGVDEPVIERPITWPKSPDENSAPAPDPTPAPTGPGSAVRRIATWAGAGLAVVAAGGAVAFWALASHPGTDLGPVGSAMTCLERTGDATVSDLAIGGVALDPSTTAEITSVRLVDPSNMTLVGSSLLTIVPAPDGSTTLPGASLGWPVPGDLRAEATVNWASEQSPLGVVLAPGARRTLLLHVAVTKPEDPAAYHAVAVAYRVGGASREETFQRSFLIPGGLGGCPADATPAG
jgi:hypothetical protein